MTTSFPTPDSPYGKAVLWAATAETILSDAQMAEQDLAREQGHDPQVQGVIAGAYASLAVGYQLASLVETVEALNERVGELTEIVDVLTLQRTRWWHRLLSWRSRRADAEQEFQASVDDALAVVDTGAVEAAAPSPAPAAEPAHDDIDGGVLAPVVQLPFLTQGGAL